MPRAEPFEIRVPQRVLDELRERLERSRRPEGARFAYLRELVDRWLGGYDWRAQEARLNEYGHFRAEVDGVLVHFVHERGRGPDPLPLVLTHGWPSTFAEYLPMLPLLVDPAAHGGDARDSFDVVVPSLPGYPFSEALPPGEFRRVPGLWARLMTDVLGYERFAAYGGDIGGMVTNRLALERPELLVGMATSFVAEPSVGGGAPPLSADEREFLAARARADERDGGYTHVFRTKPELLTPALADSPLGFAALVVEFWREWSDCGGDLDRRFERDELLTTVMLYLVGDAVESSFRPYADWALGSASNPLAWEGRPEVPGGVDSKGLAPGERIEVPAAVVLFSLAQWPREWAERAYGDLRRWTVMPRGGHFGALEEPGLLTEELRAFFRPLRGSRRAAVRPS